MKNKKIKSKKIINDNRKQLSIIVGRVYSGILKLDTDTLQEHSFNVYRELISRYDYNELDDIIGKYNILRDELIRRGVDV